MSAIAKVGIRGNLRLLGIDGGVIGRIDRDWHSKTNAAHELHGLAVSDGHFANRTTAPDARCKFLLGDFKALGQFLADQLPSLGDHNEAKDAD
jgi:hypothetical protein